MGKNLKHLNLSAVVIETERLKIVPISMQWKIDIFHEFTSEITTYMYPAPAKHSSDTEKFIKESMIGLANGTDLQLVILKKNTDEFLGCAGLHEPHTKHPELGVWVKKSAHRNGYGREAMTAIKEWADENIDYEYILYPVDRDNITSRKIPESLGGEIVDSYDKTNESGKILHTIVYHIPPSTDIHS
ncbi:MAG: GNAT family N-acetyltransferase [Candidatus Peribacteraceae bacterium]|jgi:RimJ/RimL family protein N-acetyltransferase